VVEAAEDQEVQEGGVPLLPPPRQQSPSLVLPEVVLDAIAVCEEVVENVTETKASLGATILS
jgi:hypothetical protein